MPRYMETAAKANEVAKQVLALIPDDTKPHVAALLAQLVNLGVRCSPRGVQHTVRFNAVRAAMRGLPVKIGMKEVQGKFGKFNALTTEPVGVPDAKPIVEGADDGDGGDSE